MTRVNPKPTTARTAAWVRMTSTFVTVRNRVGASAPNITKIRSKDINGMKTPPRNENFILSAENRSTFAVCVTVT
jgi:hypothetical protein